MHSKNEYYHFWEVLKSCLYGREWNSEPKECALLSLCASLLSQWPKWKIASCLGTSMQHFEALGRTGPFTRLCGGPSLIGKAMSYFFATCTLYITSSWEEPGAPLLRAIVSLGYEGLCAPEQFPEGMLDVATLNLRGKTFSYPVLVIFHHRDVFRTWCRDSQDIFLWHMSVLLLYWCLFLDSTLPIAVCPGDM